MAENRAKTQVPPQPTSERIDANIGCCSLEALSAFIESQRALLSRTQTDIGRLRELRGDIDGTDDLTSDCLRGQVSLIAACNLHI